MKTEDEARIKGVHCAPLKNWWHHGLPESRARSLKIEEREDQLEGETRDKSGGRNWGGARQASPQNLFLQNRLWKDATWCILYIELPDLAIVKMFKMPALTATRIQWAVWWLSLIALTKYSNRGSSSSREGTIIRGINSSSREALAAMKGGRQGISI